MPQGPILYGRSIYPGLGYPGLGWYLVHAARTNTYDVMYLPTYLFISFELEEHHADWPDGLGPHSIVDLVLEQLRKQLLPHKYETGCAL